MYGVTTTKMGMLRSMLRLIGFVFEEHDVCVFADLSACREGSVRLRPLSCFVCRIFRQTRYHATLESSRDVLREHVIRSRHNHRKPKEQCQAPSQSNDCNGTLKQPSEHHNFSTSKTTPTSSFSAYITPEALNNYSSHYYLLHLKELAGGRIQNTAEQIQHAHTIFAHALL